MKMRRILNLVLLGGLLGCTLACQEAQPQEDPQRKPMPESEAEPDSVQPTQPQPDTGNKPNPPPSDPSPLPPNSNKPTVVDGDVIVQLFNWPFAKIKAEIPQLAEAGYGQILVSPPNLSIQSDQWWGRYQPVDYRLIAGPLGNEFDFRSMIQEAHRHGMKIIVDVVLNHTANESSTLPSEAQQLNQKFGPLFTADDYHPAFCISNYNDAYQVRNGRLCGGPGDKGLPDLNQRSPRVLKVQREFLKTLHDMGADGYRLDAVKHMEPGYFKELLTPDLVQGKFIFGEIIADQSSYDRDMSPYMNETSMAFYDFPLRSTIQQAFAFGGSLGSLLDPGIVAAKKALPSARSVAFVINHDIPNNDGFRSMILDPVDEQLAYAYLMGRAEGIPFVFSDLGKAGGGGIRDDRWAYAHRSAGLKAMIAFHNKLRGQDMKVLHRDDCRLVFQRGDKGLVGINKCGETFTFPVPALGRTGQTLLDVLSQTRMNLSGGSVDLRIPARTAVMILIQP
jgi:alpha-amylase